MEPATLGEDFLQPFKSHAVLEIGNVEMVMRCKGFVMTNPASGGIPPLNSSTIMIRLRTHNQNMTVAAMQIADMKV